MIDNACCGCDENAAGSAFVAVMKDGDTFVAQSVCRLCHEDPSHRTKVIKGHFFPRSRAEAALAAAGSSSGIVAE